MTAAAPQLAAAPDAAVADRALLDGYLGGAQACFDELVRRHTPLVRSVCRRILEDEADADDATQAVFLVLLRKSAAIPRGASLAGWLYLTARTSALQMRRQESVRRRHADALMRGSAATEVEASQGLIERELRARLDAEMARLPAAQREALVLRYALGLSQAEAARRLDCPEETVHTRVTRGLARLRRRLGVSDAVLASVLLAPSASPTASPSATALAHADRLARFLRRARQLRLGIGLGSLALVATLSVAAVQVARSGAAAAATPTLAEADPLAGWSFEGLVGTAVTVDVDGRKVRALRLSPTRPGEFGRAVYRLAAERFGRGVDCSFRLQIATDYRYPRLFSFSARAAPDAAAPMPRFEDFAPSAYDQNLPDHRWFAVRYGLAPSGPDRASPWRETVRRDGAAWWDASRPGEPVDFSLTLMGGDLILAGFAVQPAAEQAPEPRAH